MYSVEGPTCSTSGKVMEESLRMLMGMIVPFTMPISRYPRPFSTEWISPEEELKDNVKAFGRAATLVQSAK